MRRRRSAALLLAVSVFAGLVGVELLARLFAASSGNDALWAELASRPAPLQYTEASADPALVYENKKDFSFAGRRISESHGILRDREASVAKPPGVFRVAVLGDSISANVSFRAARNNLQYPKELERLLNKEGLRAEVLNFASDGYGTLQEARVLKTKALAFAPDVVLLQYCYNDPVWSLVPYAYFRKPERSASAALELAESRLADTPLGDFLGVESRLFAADAGPLLADPALLRHWRRLYDQNAPLWPRVARGFQEIAALSGERKFPVFLAVFPILYDFGADKALLEKMRAQVVAEGRKNGFIVVDLEDAFRAARLIDVRKPRWDIYHPDDPGQRLAARELARAIERGLNSRKEK